MNQKEAKLLALRTATAMLNNPPEFEDAYPQKDLDKILKELDKIAETLYKKAVKIGGGFNRYTGY